jgi:porphyrinogen peroxidase
VTHPQFGIFAQGTVAHEFLEFDLRPDVDLATIGPALDGLRVPAVSAGGVNLVIAFGSDLWREIAPGEVPTDLGPFVPVGTLGGHHAPATQHDLWLWINGGTPDVVFEHARAAARTVERAFTVGTDHTGFVHRDSRDLTGFIDGTANPLLLEAPAAALVPEGRPGAGGSHVLAMRWVHDLDAFGRLSVEQQEQVFGRTRPDSIEFVGARLPPDAHIARVQIDDDAGEEIQIYRRSVPYGTTREQGLNFLAFGADRDRFDRMLRRMFGPNDDGRHDHLADFSRPVSGAYYFAPSLTLLAMLAGRP